MKQIIFSLASLFGCVSLGAEPPPKVSTSFYAFEYVPNGESIYIHGTGQDTTPIQLSKANIIGPVNVVLQDGVLPIYDKAQMVEGKAFHPRLCTARFPANLKRALVLLFPAGKDDKEPYRSIVLNHDLSDFPLGVYRMINISPHAIRGSIARNIIQAKPGGIANLKPEGEPGAVVPMRFEYYADDQWNLLTETRCAIRDDRRWLTCIYQDPASGRMNIRSIPDRSSAPPPEPAQVPAAAAPNDG